MDYHYGDEVGQQPPSETTSDGTDDSASGSERSDDPDNDRDSDDDDDGGSSNDEGDSDDSGLHDPMNSWEEFDPSATYQKKRVDPEMRRWILTKDCRRIISDAFFDNPVQNQGMHIYCQRTEPTALHLEDPLDLCCDNCIRKKNHTRHFESIYDLISFLDTSCGREPISCPVDDDDDDNNSSDLGSTTSAKTWGSLRAGNHLKIRRRVLEGWRYDCWKKNYRLCSWGPVGVMPEPVLSTLASSIKIQTVDNLLEVVPDWGYARKYGHEVLLLLEEADHEHKLEAQAQRMKTRQANKKRKLEDLQADEESKVSQGFVHAGSSNMPMALVHTRMINPIVVKHVERPTQPRPPRPQPRPVFISRPYTRTDVFDVLMNNSRRM